MASGYPAVRDSEILQINTDIVGKDTPDSIDPADVGGNMINILNLLTPFIALINAFVIDTGTSVPLDINGQENDIYIQTNGGSTLVVWRKNTTTWAVQATIPLGISYQDGIIVGLRTQIDVTSLAVYVTNGNWSINNTIYTKSIPTTINYDAPVVGSDRIDTIYANTSGQILYLAGSPSATPVKPTLPSNTIEVDSIYVPAEGTGNAYLFSSSNANTPPIPTEITANQGALLDDGGGGWYLPVTLNGRTPAAYAMINKGGVITYVPVQLTSDGLNLIGFPDNDTQNITVKLL